MRGVAGVGAIEGAASVGGLATVRVMQRLRDVMNPPAMTAGEASRVLTSSESNQAIADQIAQRTGRPFRPFTGQLSGDPQLLGEQNRILSSRQTGEIARRQLNQNYTALETFFDEINPTGGGPTTAVGRGIQNEARSQTRPRVEAARENVQAQIRELEELTAALPRAQSSQIGSQIRQLATESRRAISDAEDAAWEAVERGYAYNPDTALSAYKIPVDGQLEKTLLQLRAEAREALDPATEAGKRQLVSDRLLPDGADNGRAVLEALQAIEPTEGHAVDLHQLQVLLSALRKRERISRHGLVATDPQGRDIGRVRNALVTQRNEYLRQTEPELLAQLEEAEALTATRARLFDRGLVGSLLAS